MGERVGLAEALNERRAEILERWLQVLLGTYPAETARFLTGVADPFGNPVGQTLRAGVDRLYDALVGGHGPDAMAAAADGIVRIRAVQEFPPSVAVGFALALRPILREELAGAALADAERAALDDAVDRMALAAFDVYMQCREKIFEIRVRELRDARRMAERLGA
ncbi:MAG TPA: RsbRD N-terminal domain-containing protein [bacterium]